MVTFFTILDALLWCMAVQEALCKVILLLNYDRALP